MKSVNADGSIEVLEANREGSPKGGKMVTHTYTSDAVKKMTFSVAPTGTSQITTGKKPATFNAYIEKLQIPDIELDDAGIKQMIELAKREYPTESEATIANALRNRAPDKLKAQIDKYAQNLTNTEEK